MVRAQLAHGYQKAGQLFMTRNDRPPFVFMACPTCCCFICVRYTCLMSVTACRIRPRFGRKMDTCSLLCFELMHG